MKDFVEFVKNKKSTSALLFNIRNLKVILGKIQKVLKIVS